MEKHTIVALWFGLALVCLPATAGRANPIATERDGTIGLAADGEHIVFEFLGLEDDYDDSVVAQLQTGAEWTTVTGKWGATGTTQTEGGSGLMQYHRFRREVECPRTGAVSYRLRVVFGKDQDLGWELAEESVDCVASADFVASADIEGCSTGSGTARGSFAALLMLALLLVWRRAWR